MYYKYLTSKLFKEPSYSLIRIKRKLSHHISDSLKLMLQPYSQQSYADIVNQKEIRVIGLRRSGNHAIINWIEKQQSGTVVHLNNIRVNENPYLCLYESLCHDSPYYQWSAKKVLRYPLYQGRAELMKRESRGDFLKKDCLIYSYEDYSPQKVFNSFFFQNT